MSAKNENACSNETRNEEDQEGRTKSIRVLNDSLRKYGWGGQVLITDGIVSLGPDFAKAVLKAVQDFNSFSDENDPHGEHDFGSANVMHRRILWKIDYYDREGTLHSPDPASNKVTLRILTVMLSEEY